MVMWGFVERVGDPVPLVAAGRVAAPRRRPDRRGTRGDGPRGRRRHATASDTMVDRGPGVLGARRRSARLRGCAADQADAVCPTAHRRADLRCRRRAGRPADRTRVCRPAAWSRCATSAAAAPPSRWPTRARACSRSARSLRYAEFSGEQIDQALLNHVLAGLADAGNADPASTAAVGVADPVARRVPAGQGTAVRRDRDRHPGRAARHRSPMSGVTRAELESLIDRAAGRLPRCARRCVGAQQNSGRQPVGGRHRRRRRGDPVDHPAAVRAAAGPGGDDCPDPG